MLVFKVYCTRQLFFEFVLLGQVAHLGTLQISDLADQIVNLVQLSVALFFELLVLALQALD